MGHEQENGIRAYAGGIDRNVIAIHMDGTTSELPTRLDLRNHPPDGFAWGYGGSGPAQLALAILAHFLQDDDKASRLLPILQMGLHRGASARRDFRARGPTSFANGSRRTPTSINSSYVEEAQP